MVEYFSLINEFVIAFTGYAICVVTLRKDSKNVAHKLLALSLFLIGVYGTSIAIYDLIGIESVLHFFARFGIIALFFGVLFLYFTFQVIVHTKVWLEEKIHTWPFLIGVAIYGIVFYAWEGAIEITPGPVVNSKIALSMMAILGVSVLLILLVTMFNLYRFGIKPSEGVKRRKMILTLCGFLISIVALVVNVASNLPMVDDAVGTILDSIYFLILAVGMIFIAYGFIGPSRN